MPILILPDEVASQIAAGEVVERPASVVKELLENALDAGASKVVIQVERAGRKLIEVLDDGAGIAFDQLLLAVSRHATSKLRTAQDLQQIRTLGFRGEALASIGSVAHMTIQSRTQNADLGGQLEVHGGRIGEVAHTGMPVGTTVSVRDLFFNVPARLKFLKTDSTERQRIDEFVTRYALAYHQVAFHLLHDQKSVLKTNGSNDQREVLAALYGVELARQMIEVSFEEETVRVSGYISPLSVTRANRKEMTFFVNGRWVQDVTLSSSLLRAYQNFLMVGRFPLAFLFIQMPPELVDVNVHPTKAEVRFEDAGFVFSRVQRAARRALMTFSPVPQIPQRLWGQPARTAETSFPQAPLEAFPGEPPLEGPPPAAPAGLLPTVQTRLPESHLPLLRLVGQVGATYLVAEGPDGLYLIDQHAAHERVLFERFLRREESGGTSQALLEPVVFSLAPEKARVLEGQLDLFAGLGIQVESFGPNTFRVHSVPAFLAGVDPRSIVQVAVEEFEEDEAPLAGELEKRLVARICKRAAVKGGQQLSAEEQKRLLLDLENCLSPRTCPHGRPTMIHLSVDLLERQFGRRGSR